MGSTYGGNPVACAAALAVFEIFEEENLLARANQIGERVAASWRKLQVGVATDVFGDVRQFGGMIAVECVKDGNANAPNGEIAAKILLEARQRGLIITTAGAYAQCLRCLTPLVISDEMLDEGLEIFADAASSVLKT